MSKLFDNSIDVMGKAMDMYLVRHAVITDNIANANTPGYKARRVDFEAELAKAVDDIESGGATTRDIASILPGIHQDATSEEGLDKNTVDMDREMSAMTKNDVKYSAAAQQISKKFALLKYAITDGGR